jgi:dTDP-4-dehydrorhamnose 3,5-epimerase
MFEIINEPADGLKLLKPKVHGDQRGYFFESYSLEKLSALGIGAQFVQDNESKSRYGTIRGLHFQRPPRAQTKLVRVAVGKVLDVVVDIRPQSKTYGKVFSFELSEENKHILHVPKGFAHGYSTLSEEALFIYKCDNYYAPASEAGIMYNDPDLKIDWRVPKDKMILSERDKKWPLFKDFKQ